MNTSATVLALALALIPVAALTQSERPATPGDLPREPRTIVGEAVPGVGATPGVVITLDTPATRCSADAALAADGLMTPDNAVRTCTDAIVSGVIPKSDLAGTLVNRGVLLMTMSQPDEAKRDFDQALQVEPSLAEALVNRGIILHQEGRLQEALASLDQGIALGPERPERAYLTRGLVREDLKDVRGAYNDFKMAERLRPDWAAVLAELSRFQVRPPVR